MLTARRPAIGMQASALALLAALAGACGETEQDTSDVPTVGSGGGAAGNGNTSSTGGSSSGGATGCPTEEPRQDTPCNLISNELCVYGECCADVFSCEYGVWETAEIDCDRSTCPATPPEANAKCSCAPSVCHYDFACPLGNPGEWVATCLDTGWSLQVTDCTIPCGPRLVCAGGEICVKGGGFVDAYSCAANPCGADPVSCECADSLCGPSEVCSGYKDGVLTCACPSCF